MPNQNLSAPKTMLFRPGLSFAGPPTVSMRAARMPRRPMVPRKRGPQGCHAKQAETMAPIVVVIPMALAMWGVIAAGVMLITG